MTKLFWVFSSCLLIIGLGSGCTRSSGDGGINLKFADWQNTRAANIAHRSKLSTLSTETGPGELEALVINVTGAGITQPIIYGWQADEASTAPPTSVNLTVPRGNDRLVQVAAIFHGTGMEFYYADSHVDVNDTSVSVALELQNVATSLNLTQGKYVGRFLTAPNHGYTGNFQYRFNPPSGAPSMIIHQSEMFSGWGEVTSFSSPLISYTLPNGKAILDGLQSDGGAYVSTSNHGRALRIRLPSGWENQSWVTGQYDMRARPTELLTIGFFGYEDASDAGEAVCYQTPATLGAATGVSHLYKTYDPASPLTPPSQSITFIGSLSGGDSTLQAGMVPIAGNASGSDGAALCPSSSLFSQGIQVDATQLKDASSAAGFRAPFAKATGPGNGDMLDVQYDSSNQALNLTWKTLPGVDSALAGYHVFMRSLPAGNSGSDDDLRRGEGYACNKFASMGMTELIPTAPAAGSGVQTWTLAVSGVTDSQDAQSRQFVVCPLSNYGQFFRSAISGRFNGSQQPILGLKLVGNMSNSDTMNQAMLPGSTKFSKASFSNSNMVAGHTVFAPVLNGQMILGTDVISADVSIDNKTTWASVSVFADTNSKAVFNATSIPTALSTAWTATTDQNLYIRFKVGTTFQTQNKLSTDTFISPAIQVIGSRCQSPTSYQLVRSDGAVYTSATLLNDFDNVANATDLSSEYHLEAVQSASDCTGLSLPIDHIGVSGGSCFSQADIRRSDVNPFNVIVDPTDAIGGDCNLASTTVGVYVPESSPIGVSRTFTSSDNIKHSTQVANAAVYVDANSLSDLGSTFLQLKQLISGPGNVYQAHTVQVNSDNMPVSRAVSAIFANAAVNWADPANIASLWGSGLPTANASPLLSTAAAASLSPVGSSTFSRVKVDASSTSGQFDTLIHKGGFDVIGTSTLWGSEVMIARDGSNNVKIYFVPRDGSGSDLGKSLVDLTPPGGITTTGKVFFVPSPNGGGSAATFAVAYGNTLLYGALTSNNGYSVIYSNTFATTNPILAMMARTYNTSPNVSALEVATTPATGPTPTLGLAEFPWPVVSGATVATPTASASATSSVNSSSSWMDVLACDPQGNRIFAISRESSTSVKIYRMSGGTGSGTVSLSAVGATSSTALTIDSGFDKAVCSSFSAGSSGSVAMIMFFNSGSGSGVNPILATVDDNGGSCSGTGDGGTATVSGWAPTPSTVGIIAGSLNSGNDLHNGLVVGTKQASPALTNFVQITGSCSSRTLSLTSRGLGALQNSPGDLTGVAVHSTNWDSQAAQLSIFGKNGQLSVFELR